MEQFKFDKTAIWCGTHEENEKRKEEFHNNLTPEEKLALEEYYRKQLDNFILASKNRRLKNT